MKRIIKFFEYEKVWMEFIGGLGFLLSFILLFYPVHLFPIKATSQWWLLALVSILVFWLGGGREKRLPNFLFLTEASLVFFGILIIGSKLINENSFFTNISLPDKIGIMIWVSLLWVLLFVFLYKVFFRPDAYVVFGWYFNRFYAAFFNVLMILLMALVLHKALDFLHVSLVPNGGKNPTSEASPDYYVEIMGALFALIAIGGGFGTYLLQSRIQRIDRLEEMINETKAMISTVVEIIIANLPPFTVTQHITLESRNILAEIDRLIKASPHLLRYLDEEPAKGAKVWLAMGVCSYTTLKLDSIDIFAKILKMKNEGKTIDDEAYGTTLWRLGIAYRQFRMYIESRDTFHEMKKHRLEEYRNLAIIGKSITDLAEVRNRIKSRMWGRRRGIPKDLEKELTQSLEGLNNLWENGYRDPWVIWYLVNIAYEMNRKDRMNKENFRFIRERFEGVKNTSEDYAVKANYGFALVMINVIEYYHKGTKPNIDNISEHLEEVENCANLLPDSYPLMYSERSLREIHKKEAIADDIKTLLQSLKNDES